jgi:hypothetical protein
MTPEEIKNYGEMVEYMAKKPGVYLGYGAFFTPEKNNKFGIYKDVTKQILGEMKHDRR